MKYNLSANQKAVFDLKLEEQIDIIDTIIFDFILSFSSSPSCKKFIDNDKLYFWVKWDLITKNIPLLPVKTRGSVYKRIKKLIDCGLLESHSDNQIKSMSFYTLTKKADRFLIGNLSNSQEDTPYSSKDTGSKYSISQNVQGCISKDTGGVSNNAHNNTIIDNTISNNNLYKKENSEKESTPTKQVEPMQQEEKESSSASLLGKDDKWYNWKTDVEKFNTLVEKHFDYFNVRRGMAEYSNRGYIKSMLVSLDEDYPLQLEAYIKGKEEGLFIEGYKLQGWLSDGWSSCLWTERYKKLLKQKQAKEKKREENAQKYSFRSTNNPTTIAPPKKPVNGFAIQ